MNCQKNQNYPNLKPSNMPFVSVNGRVVFFVEPITYANLPFEALKRYVPELDHVSCTMLCDDDPAVHECSMRVTRRLDAWIVEQGSFVTEWRGGADEAWCMCRIFDLLAPDGGVFRIQWCGPADLFAAEMDTGFEGLRQVMPFGPGKDLEGVEGRYGVSGYWSDPVHVAEKAPTCNMMVVKLHGAPELMAMIADQGYKRSRDEAVVADAPPARLARTDTQAILEPAIDEETREQARILAWMNEE